MEIDSFYRYESHLIYDFENLLDQERYKIGAGFLLNYANEYNFRNGRTDIISKNEANELIAFEAKLSNWKKALNQAYRNTSFAHYSFVLLPFKTALKALAWEYEFIERNVGIYTIKQNELISLIVPDRNTPLQPWLTEEAIHYIEQNNYDKIIES